MRIFSKRGKGDYIGLFLPLRWVSALESLGSLMMFFFAILASFGELILVLLLFGVTFCLFSFSLLILVINLIGFSLSTRE